ncbi:MAG: hypothetical protein WBQ25_07010 [Nitrososphaeraceae archaeon]
MKSNRNNGIAFGMLLAIALSLAVMTTGITKVLGQTNPLNPSQDQGTSGGMSSMNMSSASPTGNQSTVTRDTITVLLQGQTIPGKGFLHIYDSTPYMINAGHVALHVPCDLNSKANVNVLIGPAPAFKVVEPDIIKELSQPGNMCLYHVDIDSDSAKKIYQTDVALQNPSDQPITFPPSSTAVVGVNEIQPGVPGG